MREVLAIAPNFKRRFSGVTSTIIRLLPVQAARFPIRATGPGLPEHMPHLPVWRVMVLPNDRWRVWHARRNTEMLAGLILRHVLRRKLKLLFTSAAQRRHSGYTRWLIRRMDRVVATSAKSASYLEREADVILHGVDTETFRPAEDKAALRARLGLPQGVLVGAYGRVRHQKGIDLFAEALCRVMPEAPEVQAVVMGRVDNAAYVAAIKERVAAAGLQDRFHFVEERPIEELAERFAALDLYVAPQRWEGFGLTPLEAMASGLPVIATRVGAFEDLIAEGEVGRLVDVEDVDGLTAGIREALGRSDWAAAARARVMAQFRLEDEADALIAIYREMLGTAPQALRNS